MELKETGCVDGVFVDAQRWDHTGIVIMVAALSPLGGRGAEGTERIPIETSNSMLRKGLLATGSGNMVMRTELTTSVLRSATNQLDGINSLLYVNRFAKVKP